MRFLGWLKGKGMLMGGLVAMCLLPLSGCPESTPGDKPDTQQEDVWARAYGIWDANPQPGDVEEDPGPMPVYGVWEDVMPEVNPPQDVYGIWPEDIDNDLGPVDIYGVDIGASEDWKPLLVDTIPEPDTTEPQQDVIMGAYGIWDVNSK